MLGGSLLFNCPNAHLKPAAAFCEQTMPD